MQFFFFRKWFEQFVVWSLYIFVSLFSQCGLFILKVEWLHAHYLSLLVFIWKSGGSENLAFKSLLTFSPHPTDLGRNQFGKKKNCYQLYPIPMLYKKLLIMWWEHGELTWIYLNQLNEERYGKERMEVKLIRN